MHEGIAENYFVLFDLPEGYALDVDLLEARFKTLQHTMHPDRFASTSDQEKRIAMQKAAHINEAYRVLRDPIARARYMLEQCGHSFQDERTTHQDPKFLMEQMELRELLAEVREQAEPLQVVVELMQRIDESFQRLEEQLSSVLGSDSVTVPEAAVAVIQRMQFFRRLAEEAAELEASLEEELDDF